MRTISLSAIKNHRPSILVIFAESCKLFIKHRNWLLCHLLIIHLPLVLLRSVPQKIWELYLTQQDFLGEYEHIAKAIFDFLSGTFSFAAHLLLGILSFAFIAFPIVFLVHSSLQGETLSYSESLKQAVRKIKAAVLTNLIERVIWSGITVALILLLFPLNFIILTSTKIPINGDFIVVNNTLLIIILLNLIFLSTTLIAIQFALSFYPAAIALRDLAGFKAIAYSLRVIRFAPIRIAASFLLGSSLAYLLHFIYLYTLETGPALERVQSALLLWSVVDLGYILSSLFSTVLGFLAAINGVLIFLNTDALIAEQEAK